MRKLALISVVLVALVVTSAASAGNPYRFSSRTGFEHDVVVKHLALPGGVGKRYTVKSIGCAKAGVGRAVCVVVASSPRQGVQSYAMTISCPSDTNTTGCRYTAQVVS